MVNRRLLLLGLLLLLFVSPAFAWLDGWQYRRAVTIENSGSTTLTDFQVKIVVDTASLISAGKMNSDCSDLRFTDSSDNQLPYWIEANCNTSNTVVWVKVPSIPANGSTTIYMYYGNPAATSESDGGAVFDFFDDFDGTAMDTSKWDVSGDITVSDSVAHMDGSDLAAAYVPYNLENGYVVEQRVRVTDVSNDGYSGTFPEVCSSDSVGSSNANSDAVVLYMVQSAADGTGVYYYVGDGSTTGYNVTDGAKYANWDVTVGQWYVTGLAVTPSSVKVYVDGTLQDSVAVSWAKEMHYVHIGLFSPSYSNPLKPTDYDWIRVRKYADPEPTVTVSTTEETFSVGVSVGISHTPIAVQDLALDPENNVTNITVDYNAVISASGVGVTEVNVDGNTVFQSALSVGFDANTVQFTADGLDCSGDNGYILLNYTYPSGDYPDFSMFIDFTVPSGVTFPDFAVLAGDNYIEAGIGEESGTLVVVMDGAGYSTPLQLTAGQRYTLWLEKSGDTTSLYQLVNGQWELIWQKQITGDGSTGKYGGEPIILCQYAPDRPDRHFPAIVHAFALYPRAVAPTSPPPAQADAFTTTFHAIRDGEFLQEYISGYYAYRRVYTAVGDYNTCVAVEAVGTDGQDYNATACDSVHIDAYPQHVTITYAPHIILTSDTVEFNASATDNGTLTYDWQFSDGNTATGQNVTHTFGTSGTHSATVTVTDDLGLSKTTTVSFPVYSYQVVTDANAIEMEDHLTEFRPSDNWDLEYNAAIHYLDGNAAGTIKQVGNVLYATYTVPENTDNEENHTVYFYLKVCNAGGECREFNTDTNTFTSYKMVLTDCSTLTTTKALTFKVYNEENVTQEVTSATVDSVFTIYNNKGFSRQYAFHQTSGSSICIYPSWATYRADAVINYYATDYTQRIYNIVNGTLDSNTDTLNLYLLPTAVSTATTIKVTNEFYEPLPDVVVKILRYYFADNTYKPVTVLITDAQGQATAYLKQLEFYKIILEQDGKVVKDTGLIQLTDTTLSFVIGGETPEGWETLYNVNIKCADERNTDTNTITLTCEVSDPTNLIASGNLLVERTNVNARYTECNKTENGSAFVLSCELPDGYNYEYKLTLTTSAGYTFTAAQGKLNYGTNPFAVPFVQFAVFLAVVTLDIVALMFPLPAFVLMHVLGLAALSVVGLIPIGWGWFVWLGIGAIIVVVRKNVVAEG